MHNIEYLSNKEKTLEINETDYIIEHNNNGQKKLGLLLLENSNRVQVNFLIHLSWKMIISFLNTSKRPCINDVFTSMFMINT